MPREKEGRFWGEAGAVYLCSGSNQVKVWGTVQWVLVGGLLWLGVISEEMDLPGKWSQVCGQELDGQGATYHG